MLTCASLIESLAQYRLLTPAQLDEARPLPAAFPEPRALADELTRRGWLTPFQIRMLARGQGKQLIVGPYVILEKLGEGGMGAVYKARNSRFGRVVAIKLLRKEKGTKPELIVRFRREVEAVSQLNHPNVVRALDADEIDGNLVFEMEYVEGINLTQLVYKRGPLPVPMACDFVRQTALGLQHAHEKGLVHRDIKPSNLVVTRSIAPSAARPYGHIKLLDMGLALVQTPDGGQEKTRLTQLGKVVGTTDFLSPEQARNSHGVDIRTDLYSLGCTLYFLLTGKVPFPDGAAMEKLLKHQLDEPTPVEELRPEVPPGVVAVVRKLMAKRVENRYQTPAEAAALLEPFAIPPANTTPLAPPALPTPTPPNLPPVLPSPMRAKAPSSAVIPTLAGGKPPSAPGFPAAAAVKAASGRVAVLDQAANAAAVIPSRPRPDSDPFLQMTGAAPTPRKNRARGPLVAVLGVAMLSSLSLGAYYVFRTSPAPKPEPAIETKPIEKLPPPKPDVSPLDQITASRIADIERIRDQPNELVAVFGEHRQRHWSNVSAVAYSPDGNQVVTFGNDGFLRLWDTKTGREMVHCFSEIQRLLALSFAPDGSVITVDLMVKKDVKLVATTWDMEKRTAGRVVELGKEGRNISAAAISPDGQSVAVAGWRKAGDVTIGEMWMYTIDTTDEKTLPSDKSVVTFLTWSPDSKRLAGAAGKTVRLWDATARKDITPMPLPAHDQPITGLTFAQGGKVLVSAAPVAGKDAGLSSELKFWQLPAGTLRETKPVAGQISSLVRDAQGRALAWGVSRGGNYRIVLWNVDGNRERHALEKLDAQPLLLAFAPDGATLTSIGADQTVRLWDAAAGKELVAPPSYHGLLQSPVFAPDGQSLAVLSSLPNRFVVVWDLAANKEKILPRLKGKFGQILSYVGDGKTLACWGTNGVSFWETATGKETAAFKPPAGSLLVGPLAPDGHGAVVVGKDLVVRLWDPLRDRETAVLKEQAKDGLGTVAWSPDGKLLAVAGFGQPGVRLHEARSGKDRGTLKGLPGQAVQLAFSPDGARLAAGARDGKVHIWDVKAETELCSVPVPGGASALAFTGNGDYVVLWGPRRLAVVDIAAKKARDVPFGFVTAVAPSPQGQSFAVATDFHVILVNAATPEKNKWRTLEMPGPVHALTFAADGRHLVTSNGNGTLYLLRLDAK